MRRAARLADGVFMGPQVAWRDIQALVEVYKQERQQAGYSAMGMIGASRSLIVGRDKAEAAARARDYLAKTFANYKRWRMQERTMVPLQLDFDVGLDAWTIHGSPQDCVETIRRARDEIGLEYIGFTIYSLPTDVQARIDYLHMIAEYCGAGLIRCAQDAWRPWASTQGLPDALGSQWQRGETHADGLRYGIGNGRRRGHQAALANAL